MSVVTRRLRWQDLPSVAELEAHLHPDDPWGMATWWAELAERPRRDYVVRADGDRLLGYAGVDLGADTADVMTMGVAPSAQGQGHGGALLRHLHAAARAAGCRAVLLEVREDNIPARTLYDRHGYALVHRRRGYYQPGGVDALVLRHDLDHQEDRRG